MARDCKKAVPLGPGAPTDDYLDTTPPEPAEIPIDIVADPITTKPETIEPSVETGKIEKTANTAPVSTNPTAQTSHETFEDNSAQELASTRNTLHKVTQSAVQAKKEAAAEKSKLLQHIKVLSETHKDMLQIHKNELDMQTNELET